MVRRRICVVSNHEAGTIDNASHPSKRAQKRAPQDEGHAKIKQKENAMIEFFFDCPSPWTYLAFHNIQPLAKEFGTEISWRPILVGGIFNTINPSVYATREKPVEAKG